MLKVGGEAIQEKSVTSTSRERVDLGLGLRCNGIQPQNHLSKFKYSIMIYKPQRFNSIRSSSKAEMDFGDVSFRLKIHRVHGISSAKKVLNIRQEYEATRLVTMSESST
jgi:hypothetical protein